MDGNQNLNINALLDISVSCCVVPVKQLINIYRENVTSLHIVASKHPYTCFSQRDIDTLLEVA
eukprot:snap_masked-scaffold_7-processed-gene-3.16-mRNA-1 protein AED:1.00 eAED:1.00 QI:0/0/0/0/1/1/2/0/62